MSVATINPVSADVFRPFWSVMIPTFEPDHDLLRRSVDSVLESGLAPGERQIALVEDGTQSPGMDRLLEGMRELGIEVHRFRERAGIAANWNRCLALARGHWVHILHQDDRVRPGFYDALAAGIAADPTIGAAFTRQAYVDASGRELHAGHMPQRGAGVLHDWIERVFVNLVIQCPSIAVRRAVYERLGGFDDSFAYCPDLDMWQRIASEYPLWYEPRTLAEYRVHSAGATQRLFSLPLRWRERRKCFAAGQRLLSPAVRSRAARSAQHYRARAACRELRDSWAGLGFRARLAGLLSLARPGDLFELAAVWRGRYPAPLPGNAAVRGRDPGAPRRPRILLISELFPASPERFVYGTFQRLRRHVEACGRVGLLDAVFFWPDNAVVSADEAEAYRVRLLPSWPIEGRLVLIPAASGEQGELRRRPLQAAWWTLRGAVSFFKSAPTLRTSGQLQVELLREALLASQPDLIFAHRLGAIGALVRAGGALPPIVLDVDDLEHVRIARASDGARGPLQRLRVAAWRWIARRATRVAVRRSFSSFICSQHDRAILAGMAPSARIDVVPNMSNEVALPPPAAGPMAMFVGLALYPPNEQAIRVLLADIWPRVRRLVPDACLTVVSDGAASLGLSVPDGCTLLDSVPDLGAVYRASRVALCPILSGGGTRIKIIEAAMHARPVVSTLVGAEGLTFSPGVEILLTDDMQTFAEHCAALLRDPARSEAIGRAARTRALREYAPARVVAQVAGVLEQALAARTANAQP